MSRSFRLCKELLSTQLFSLHSIASASHNRISAPVLHFPVSSQLPQANVFLHESLDFARALHMLQARQKGDTTEMLYRCMRKATSMMGSKQRHFAPLIHVSLEELVPQDHFYRHLERTLDLSFVQQTYEGGGRPSIDPIVFFKLQLVLFFEGIRSEW